MTAARAVEVVLVGEPRERLVVLQRSQLARGGADLLAELERPPDALALPERHGAGNPGRRRDEHAVARDLLDPPRRGAEQERLTGARLVDHLLVELADAPAPVDEEDAEEAAVGDRPGVRDGETAGAFACAHGPAGAVPDDARPQLRELVRRVAAGEHVEHVLELRTRELLERIGARDERVQIVDAHLFVDGDRDDLLRQHVEGVAWDLRLLDLAAAHRARDDRGLEQVGAELREDAALRDRAQLVPRASDALQAARDRLRRLDLDHEVDRAHVDAELEARRRDEARDPPRLQILLDELALLAREGAVMSARDLAQRLVVAGLRVRELVQAQREPLGEPAVVDEDDRRAMLLDEPQDLRVDRRPDRVGAALGRREERAAVGLGRVLVRDRLSELAHVLDRHHDLQVELLARARVDECDLAPTRNEPADLLERALRRRERDPLHRPLHQLLQALDADRHVRAALRACNCMHLVDDQRLDRAQHVAGLRGQHQVERLGRRDQDVGRILEDLASFLLRRVAGAHRDAHLRLQAGQRAAQVPLDVVVERLQRRDVEHAQALARRRAQPVERVEERGQGLARPGRRLDQHVGAARNRRPALDLRRRRPVEGALEPVPRRLGED